jgi:hypothetical protein
MLKQLADLLRKISRGIEEGIESPCELRIRLEEHGLEISAWSLLNTKQQHCYTRFFNEHDLTAGGEKPLVQFIYEACRFFKTKQSGQVKAALTNETLTTEQHE